jgi:alpha-tubulin suppressor-like RCC1 family protein
VGSFIYQKLFAADSTACGLMLTGELKCWGANATGMLGNGGTANSNTPVPVYGVLRFKTAAIGKVHVCAITTSNAPYCWGDNTDGVLGTNSNAPSLVPVAVALAPALAVISAGAQHTCGATSAGVVYCWGKNSAGEMGSPLSTTGSLVPLVTGFSTPIAELSTSGRGNCGRTITPGPAQCWGANPDGQLNVAATTTPDLPQAVRPAGAVSFSLVRLAPQFGCSIGSDGAVYCWGGNASGQLGDGTTAASLTPVRVRSR